MKLHQQRIKHDPANGKWGDCHRTAYAMVLGLEPEDVPHVFDEGRSPEEGNAMMAAFLADRGLGEISFTFPGEVDLDLLLTSRRIQAPGVSFILGGKSRLGSNHSVAVLDGVIFDPSDNGIIGPCDDGFYWITYVGILDRGADGRAGARSLEADLLEALKSVVRVADRATVEFAAARAAIARAEGRT